jgi:hypothetical protein
MPGGLLNIAAQGAENVILTGNPSKTFFQATYKKYTNFGLQRFRIDKKGSRVLNYNSETEMKFKIPRYAELLWDTYLVVNMPDIWSPFFWNTDISCNKTPFEFQWIEKIGALMIKDITIYAGSNILSRYSGEYMSVTIERDDTSKKELWNRMVGNINTMTNPAKAYQNGNNYPNTEYNSSPEPDFLPTDVKPSIKGRQLYIPLESWFCKKNGKLALPLVALQYQEVEISIRFRPIKELYTILNVSQKTLKDGKGDRIAPGSDEIHNLYWFMQPPQDPSGIVLSGQPIGTTQIENYSGYYKKNTWNADIHLLGTYVFLSDDEIRVFAASEHKYLVKEIYEHDNLNIGGSRRVDIPSRDMVSSYAFRFRRSDVYLRNQWTNYTNWEFENISPKVLEDITSCGDINPFGFLKTPALKINTNHSKMILLDLGILLGAEYRENTLNAGVYNYVEKWIRSDGIAKDGLYLYNFAVNTNRNHYQPSGAQNTNKWKYVTFEFNTIEPPIDPSGNEVSVLCDEDGAIIGIRKDSQRLNQWNYDLRVFEERYNMIVIESGSIGLLNAR